MAAVTIGWRWRDLAREHRRWIIVHALIVSAAINFTLTGVSSWLSVRGQHLVPLFAVPRFGSTNIVTDTLGTFFFLPLMTCLILTTFVGIEVRSGRLPPLTAVEIPERLRGGRLRRGAVLGAVSAVILSPLAVVALLAVAADGLTVGQFVLYKILVSVALGAVVTPLIALCAMADLRQA